MLALALLHAHGAAAQNAPADTAWIDAPLTLQRTPQIPETIPQAEHGERPSFIEGDRLSGRPNLETVVEGNASLRRGDTAIRADRLEYYQPDDTAKATGNVHVNQAGNTYDGPELQLKVETFEGFFNNVRYAFLAGGHGDAPRIDFVDSNVSVARNATYTTCRREDYPGWMPAWLLTAATLTTDTEENVGVATDARLSFMGITTPALPSMSFPLSSDRKSGLLAPTFGYGSTNGLEWRQPYYWNIAPNRDATFYANLMSSRGIDTSSEFRYLEDTYHGQVRVDYMPSDTLRDRERWGFWSQHNQTFDPKPFGLDSLSGSLTINRVSDNDYWRDFSQTPSLTTRLLTNQAALDWSKGDWSGEARALAYQTLQYAASPVTPPYDRMPQLTANYNKYDWNGFDVSVGLDYTRFHIDSAYAPTLNGIAQPNGERMVGNFQISRPWVTPSAYVIPKLLLHTAAYQLDSPLASGATSITSTVPTFSLDSGLVFERDTSFFGRAVRQTLEPRMYYVHTPYRDQSQLPVYDTAANDFSFATIYTENAFSGNDRVSDTNTLTTGVTSRLIDPDTGVEAARLGFAQRFRFSDQNVTLPSGTAVTDRVSDFLIGGQVNWSATWSSDALVQYNIDTHTSTRNALSLRYAPAPQHVLNFAYRYSADTTTTSDDGTRSIDLSWQWPLSDLWDGNSQGPTPKKTPGRWSAVGRINYSMRDHDLGVGVVGFEYNACCWIGRIALERQVSGVTTPTTRLMFQIEFNGLASVGSSPTSSFAQNIQGYQSVHSTTSTSSRFTNYD
ncbi:LPS-assembly protein LptD [Variovorax ginsengisoli]|nr:LPS-assembly protein LptD [Variovorax ginsengisoli]